MRWWCVLSSDTDLIKGRRRFPRLVHQQYLPLAFANAVCFVFEEQVWFALVLSTWPTFWLPRRWQAPSSTSSLLLSRGCALCSRYPSIHHPIRCHPPSGSKRRKSPQTQLLPSQYAANMAKQLTYVHGVFLFNKDIYLCCIYKYSDK